MPHCVVRLSAAAEKDFRQILLWTVENFGAAQAEIYAQTLSLALQALVAGNQVAGAKIRSEIAPDTWTLHVARKGRKGRHFVVFRVTTLESGNFADILRLLHDSMDLSRHVDSGE